MIRNLAYGVSAIAVLTILGLIADFYRRFHYGMSLPEGIAGIGLFAVVSGIVITRVGRNSTAH